MTYRKARATANAIRRAKLRSYIREARRIAQRDRREYLRRWWLTLLDAKDWNYVHAAAAAGIKREILYGILDRLDIRREREGSPLERVARKPRRTSAHRLYARRRKRVELRP